MYPQVGLNAVAGRAKEEWSMEPARFDEMRRGCYDIEARVRDMDLDGVFASLCFPSLIAGFAGTIFANSKDQELGLACAARVERLAHRGVGRPASRSRHPAAARVGERSRDRGGRHLRERRARLQGGELSREPRRPEAARRCTTATGIRSCARAKRPRPSCASTTVRRRGPRRARPARRSSCTRGCSR